MYNNEEPFHFTTCRGENDEMARVSCSMAGILKLNIEV